VVKRLRVAAVEPYFGGSHAHFLRDLARHSRHRFELFTLPARQWKWRVRGAALHAAPAIAAAACRRGFDVLFCSDFVNVPDLRALLPARLRSVPVLYYLHENQLGYPLSPDETFDPYFGFTNVLSCLSAEAVAFNSEFHRRQFLAALPQFLPRLPDYDRGEVVRTITAKAEVLPVGLDVAELERHRPRRRAARRVPRIVWNHRWEFDKRPEVFFAALETLAQEGIPFVADIVGESFARRPPVFDAARARLGERIGRFERIPQRAAYVRCLWDADVVVSTASQEFFGISMAEATLCGAHPLAPKALVYPELYGRGPCARLHLYRSPEELVTLLRRRLTGRAAHDCGIAAHLRSFDWTAVAPRFDARIASLARARQA
jgi:glycosyltransferase involved in cell wall biosynthesis